MSELCPKLVEKLSEPGWKIKKTTCISSWRAYYIATKRIGKYVFRSTASDRNDSRFGHLSFRKYFLFYPLSNSIGLIDSQTPILNALNLEFNRLKQLENDKKILAAKRVNEKRDNIKNKMLEDLC